MFNRKDLLINFIAGIVLGNLFGGFAILVIPFTSIAYYIFVIKPRKEAEKAMYMPMFTAIQNELNGPREIHIDNVGDFICSEEVKPCHICGVSTNMVEINYETHLHPECGKKMSNKKSADQECVYPYGTQSACELGVPEACPKHKSCNL